MPEHDEQLLLDYANHFLGYGTLNSSLWLIGPEAGGGETIDEVYSRALVWAERGRKETEDLQGYHRDLKLSAKFDWSRKIQPTWGPLIRTILALQRGDADTVDANCVRAFQKNELGRHDGENSILDLSQLSSPSMSEWKLGDYRISWLANRAEYQTQILMPRCEVLRQKLANREEPRIVLFYGLSHRHLWERIVGSQFKPSRIHQIELVWVKSRLHVLMPHPNSVRLPGKGSNNKFWSQVGSSINKELILSDANKLSYLD